jgi:MerR family transcriptional regulator, light-induced transcriptional regulator
MNNTPSPSPTLYRIGAVSKLSGVPVPTLRVWQTRYNAFSPSTTAGQHRLYNEADLRKAALLKSLTGQGHSIGLIAGLPMTQLLQLLQTGTDMASAPRQAPSQPNAAAGDWVVIGQALASRLQSETFSAARLAGPLPVQQVWADLAQARDGQLNNAPEVLVVSVNNLNDSTAGQIQALSQQHGARQTVVLYGFGQMPAITRLGRAGCRVHREPMNDADLVDLLQSARPPLSAPAWTTDDANPSIPPRQFSDSVLQRVANTPSQVLCECPRHVAELIGQLGRFEDYSRDCLNQSPQDAELHTQLNIMAGTARALFEKALHMVAAHEGISLQDTV